MLLRLLSRPTGLSRLSLRQLLLLSCGFSCLLLLARVIITGYTTFVFLTWNLFLAIIPFLISEWLITRIRIIESNWKLALVLIAWLLFIPNTFYILTDFFHLGNYNAAPQWFDLLLIFSFAWNGLLLGILSIRRIELVVQVATGRRFSQAFIFLVMLLNAFGIYIGRYLRFNSWDVIAQPFSLFKEMMNILLHPVQNKTEWGMIGIYAVFMCILYLTIQKAGEQFSLQSTKR